MFLSYDTPFSNASNRARRVKIDEVKAPSEGILFGDAGHGTAAGAGGQERTGSPNGLFSFFIRDNTSENGGIWARHGTGGQRVVRRRARGIHHGTSPRTT